MSAALLSLTVGTAFAASSSSASSAPSRSLIIPSSAASSRSSTASVSTPLTPSPAQFFRLGDVNMDGKITSADATLVARYAAGMIQFTAQQKSLADVDADGQITTWDAQIISLYAGGVIKILPFSPLVGDVTLNGAVQASDAEMIRRVIAGYMIFPTTLQRTLADVNSDTSVDELDVEIVRDYVSGGTVKALPSNLKYGDVTQNGTLSGLDAAWVGQYALGMRTFTPLQIVLADVNLDGPITDCDATLIQQATVGLITLPIKKQCEDSAKLLINQRPTVSTQYIVKGQKDVTLLRFDGKSEGTDILVTDPLVFTVKTGNVLNAKNFTLWMDTDDNGSVDTILNEGRPASVSVSTVTFGALSSGGFIIPKDKTKIFEVHADVASSLTGTPAQLQLAFATNTASYVTAERVDTGLSLAGIQTDGVCPVAKCQILVQTNNATVYTIVPSGDLYVSQSATSVRSHQLLGGTLGDEILRVQFLAQYEDVNVTRLVFTPTGPNASRFAADVASVDLYRVGESTPFASATPNCANDATVPAYSFCAIMQSRQLVIPKTTSVTVLARPRVNNDEAGAMSGDAFALTMQTANGLQPVSARGDSSTNALSANNGNTTFGEGEVFVGTITAGPNHDINGRLNQVVLSKITNITNADPNANGTAIPTGTSKAIAQFKFTAAPNSNVRSGTNKWAADGLMFNVNATNVGIDRSSFRLYNKMDSSVRASCTVTDAAGNPLSGSASLVTGQLLVQCVNLSSSNVNTKIDAGDYATFVLQADILTGQISAMSSSTLQVSLNNFTDSSATTLSAAGSHIKWIDYEFNNPAPASSLWIEYPDTTVNGTTYSN